MNSKQNLSVNNLLAQPIQENEIDLKQVFDALIRNKLLVSSFTLAGLLISGFQAFTTKKVWQGQFQIVVESNTGQSLPGGLASFVSIPGKSDSLQTEVGILKSPSVLIDIFEFVEKQKALKNRSYKKIRFQDWQKDFLDIGLEKKTSILNLAYRDTNKELILPVLNQISNTYQKYSGRKQMKNLQLTANYLENQIRLYENKSTESLLEAQEFAISQDISVLNFNKENDKEISNKDIDKEIPNFINIEAKRLIEAEKIKSIDLILKQIKDSGNDTTKLLFATRTLSNAKDEKRSNPIEDLRRRLIRADLSLSEILINYKKSDQTAQKAIKKKDLLTLQLKNKATEILILERSQAKSLLKIAERPKGTLIEYKKLLANAKKNQATLISLEEQYRKTQLAQARSQEPWELITTPTLLPSPVAPKKKNILALGMVIGFLLGSIATLILEKRKDIIYSKSEMQKLFRLPLIAELFIKEKKSVEECFDLIKSGLLSENEEDICLIKVGEINDWSIKQIQESLIKSFAGRNFLITKDIREARKYNNLLVLTSLGDTKGNEVIEMREKLSLQNKDILGLLVLNNKARDK
tara:strand:+ start:1951 stop:3693 length:1743 start_codon:yes stop_codon:yes gene_type:complete